MGGLSNPPSLSKYICYVASALLLLLPNCALFTGKTTQNKKKSLYKISVSEKLGQSSTNQSLLQQESPLGFSKNVSVKNIISVNK